MTDSRYQRSATTTRRQLKRELRRTLLQWAVLAAILAAIIVGFVWCAKTCVPRSYPTSYNSFGWGILHGFYLAPNLLLSLFNDRVTIFQYPNTGKSYDVSFVLGVIVSYGLPKFTERLFRKKL
jgi:hypothetical protein